METSDKIEKIKSWIRSCDTDEQLVNIRDTFLPKDFNPIPEDLRNEIEDQRISIIKNEYFIYSIPTLAYWF